MEFLKLIDNKEDNKNYFNELKNLLVNFFKTYEKNENIIEEDIQFLDELYKNKDNDIESLKNFVKNLFNTLYFYRKK